MLPIPKYWSPTKKLMFYVAVMRKNKLKKASKDVNENGTNTFLKRYEKTETENITEA